MSASGTEVYSGADGNGVTGKLPLFFIVGPPRTGTSWLHRVLSQNAWLPHPTKEIRFFDKHFDRGLAWYQSHYRKVSGERIIGDVSPTYFASSLARERIARLIPHAKVVCTFRNPVDRLVSLYRLKRAYGLIRWDLEQALACDPELMESSRYAVHLKHWRTAFGEAQVLATLHEEMEADPQGYIDRLFSFLGLPRLMLLPSQIRRELTSENMTEPRSYYWTHAATQLSEWSKSHRLDSLIATAKKWGAMKLFLGGGRAFAELSPAQRERLREIFRPEVEELETMLNRDLSSWK